MHKKGRRRIREDEVLTELTPKVISKEETSNFDNIILNGVLCAIAVFIMAGIIITFTSAIIFNEETSNSVNNTLNGVLCYSDVFITTTIPPIIFITVRGGGGEEVPPMICATGPSWKNMSRGYVPRCVEP